MTTCFSLSSSPFPEFLAGLSVLHSGRLGNEGMANRSLHNGHTPAFLPGLGLEDQLIPGPFLCPAFMSLCFRRKLRKKGGQIFPPPKAQRPSSGAVVSIFLTWDSACVTGTGKSINGAGYGISSGGFGHPGHDPVSLRAFPELFLSPPLLGEHTGEVLQQLGFSGEEVQHIFAEKIVS